MKILNKYISVAYELFVKDPETGEEERMEASDKQHPLIFISKMGFALKPFETQLEELETGANFDFTIPAKDAYGEYDEELVFDVDINQFVNSPGFSPKALFEGNVITVYSPEGQTANAMILEVKKDAVTLDLNHPHAGDDLHFRGEILENRVATNEEIAAFVNMMSGGCGGCGGCKGGQGGCNSGGCGGADCSTGDCDCSNGNCCS